MIARSLCQCVVKQLLMALTELCSQSLLSFLVFRPTQESQKIFKAQKPIDIEFVRSKVICCSYYNSW